MARLQNEVSTKDPFSSREFSHEKCSEIYAKLFEPLLCGSEKIPHNYCQISHKTSLLKFRKIHRRASAGAQGEKSGCKGPHKPKTYCDNNLFVILSFTSVFTVPLWPEIIHIYIFVFGINIPKKIHLSYKRNFEGN